MILIDVCMSFAAVTVITMDSGGVKFQVRFQRKNTEAWDDELRQHLHGVGIMSA
jgi:hypothetical protein